MRAKRTPALVGLPLRQRETRDKEQTRRALQSCSEDGGSDNTKEKGKAEWEERGLEAAAQRDFKSDGRR